MCPHDACAPSEGLTDLSHPAAKPQFLARRRAFASDKSRGDLASFYATRGRGADRWEKSEHNTWHSKVEVVGLACLCDKMTEKGHSEAKPVPIELCDALESGISGDQRAALQAFKEKEPELYAKARTAIYAEYRKSYSTDKLAWSVGASLFGGDGACNEAAPSASRNGSRKSRTVWA
jgi:hypothetical protein